MKEAKHKMQNKNRYTKAKDIITHESQLRRYNEYDEPVMVVENHEEKLCVIIVYGLVPEFMPGVAFRRDKHYKTAKKKVIKCPYCGEVFKVVEVTAKLELIRYPKKDQKKVPWHKSMPCKICRNVVGVIYHAA